MTLYVASLSFLYRAAMLAGGLWCHQLPERSPHLYGAQLPVCWRCSGILAGAFVFLVWLVTKKRLPPFALSVALALLLPLDVLHAFLTDGDGDNLRRFVTGVLWGIYATGATLHLVRYIISLRAARFAAARAG